MRLLVICGSKGQHAWTLEQPTQTVRHWRCSVDSFVVNAPANPIDVDPFLAAMMAHSKPLVGDPVSITVVDT